MTTFSILLLSLASATPNPAPAAQADAQLQGVLLDFTATWCGPCQQMNGTVAKLQRQGYPVRKVDIDKERALAERFNITSIPAFVLVVNGREVQRIVGATSEGQLKQMLAQIPPARTQPVAASPAVQSPTSRTQPVAETKPGLLPKVKIPSFFKPKERAPAAVEIAASAAEADIRAQNPVPAPTASDPLSASTRIRVKDGDGINFGTGTVIESKPGRTIILTCGHIFRDMKETSAIEVDVFHAGGPRQYVGKVLTYELKADVGLLEIATDAPLGCCRVASLKDAVAEGQHVFSIGCGGGEPPSKMQMRVTKLNRYRGPDNIECTTAPIPGRSGGGLFNAAGEIVGVCFAADNDNRCGLYAGLKPVHQLLDHAGLTHVYRGSEPAVAPGRVELVSAEAPVDEGGGEALAVLRETSDNSAAAGPRRAGPQSSAAAKPVDRPGESEVICIIRPLDDPQAESRIVVINRASPKFLSYLNGEMNSQPRPTTGRIEFDAAAAGQAISAFRGAAATTAVDPFHAEDAARSLPAPEPERYVRSAASR